MVNIILVYLNKIVFLQTLTLNSLRVKRVGKYVCDKVTYFLTNGNGKQILTIKLMSRALQNKLRVTLRIDLNILFKLSIIFNRNYLHNSVCRINDSQYVNYN